MSDITIDPDLRLLEQTLFEVKKVIVGQDRLVERLLTALLAGGHCLLEGVPGVAKTLAAETLAVAVGGTFHRIQFTPDLVPSDVVGTRIYRPSRESFDVELGPVMANLVLVDEINRAPAKVQSALLEVMAEGQVSIGGRTYPVPRPFLVLATQNPIESEGVYQLPEAQRDRFLMRVVVGYPPERDELGILYRMGGVRPVARPVLDTAKLAALQGRARDVFVHHALAEYVVRLVMATRDPQISELAYGASPRATLGLVAAARALALLRGRDYVLPGDVLDIAPDVLAHRLVLSFDAVADGIAPEAIVNRLVAAVPLPSIAPAQQNAGRGIGRGRVNEGASVNELSPQRRLRRLELTITRRLDGLLQGSYLGLLPGPGNEPAGSREYRPGEDEVRRMDWAVTARTAVPHARTVDADRELATWVLVDGSASMDFGTAEFEKRELAIAAVATVGFLTAGAGNRLGVHLLTGDGVRRHPARGGRSHLLGILRTMLAAPRAAAAATPPPLAEAVAGLDRAVARRGLAVVVSDFLDGLDADGLGPGAPEWEQPLRRLAARHQVLAVQIGDLRERELPDVGLLTLVDPETGRRREVPTASRRLRDRYAAAARRQRDTVSAAIRRAGAAHLMLRTDRDWIADIVRHVQAQRRLARAVRHPRA